MGKFRLKFLNLSFELTWCRLADIVGELSMLRVIYIIYDCHVGVSVHACKGRLYTLGNCVVFK